MGIFRKILLNSAGVHHNEAGASSHDNPAAFAKDHTQHKKEKNTAVPAIPTDIGFASNKSTGGQQKNGALSQAVRNPGVILGMGLTTVALLGMMRSSFLGDKLGAQKYMQYRIMAQFFTVTALVAGVTVFGSMYGDEEDKQKH
uniref:HIG1 domain-containing protein n=1 Tax=Steinernema glaseri TaxID=37863 RepID=A0A1I7Y7Y7_9BILA